MQSIFDRLHFGVGYRCLRQYRVYDPKGAIHQGRRLFCILGVLHSLRP